MPKVSPFTIKAPDGRDLVVACDVLDSDSSASTSASARSSAKRKASGKSESSSKRKHVVSPRSSDPIATSVAAVFAPGTSTSVRGSDGTSEENTGVGLKEDPCRSATSGRTGPVSVPAGYVSLLESRPRPVAVGNAGNGKGLAPVSLPSLPAKGLTASSSSLPVQTEVGAKREFLARMQDFADKCMQSFAEELFPPTPPSVSTVSPEGLVAPPPVLVDQTSHVDVDGVSTCGTSVRDAETADSSPDLSVQALLQLFQRFAPSKLCTTEGPPEAASDSLSQLCAGAGASASGLRSVKLLESPEVTRALSEAFASLKISEQEGERDPLAFSAVPQSGVLSSNGVVPASRHWLCLSAIPQEVLRCDLADSFKPKNQQQKTWSPCPSDKALERMEDLARKQLEFVSVLSSCSTLLFRALLAQEEGSSAYVFNEDLEPQEVLTVLKHMGDMLSRLSVTSARIYTNSVLARRDRALAHVPKSDLTAALRTAPLSRFGLFGQASASASVVVEDRSKTKSLQAIAQFMSAAAYRSRGRGRHFGQSRSAPPRQEPQAQSRQPPVQQRRSRGRGRGRASSSAGGSSKKQNPQ
jgi:hypothetical protein